MSWIIQLFSILIFTVIIFSYSRPVFAIPPPGPTPTCASLGISLTPQKNNYLDNENLSIEVNDDGVYLDNSRAWYFDIGFWDNNALGVYNNVSNYHTNYVPNNSSLGTSFSLTSSPITAGSYTLILRDPFISQSPFSGEEICIGPVINIASTQANTITFGPVNFVGQKYTEGLVSIKVETNGPDGTFDKNSRDDQLDCSGLTPQGTRFPEYSCIGRIAITPNLNKDSDGRPIPTQIKIKEVHWTPNGKSEDTSSGKFVFKSGKNFQLDGSIPVWSLNAGSETGLIGYEWESNYGKPIIELSSPIIPPNGIETVIVKLPDPKASQYNIKIFINTEKAGAQNLAFQGEVVVSCPPPNLFSCQSAIFNPASVAVDSLQVGKSYLTPNSLIFNIPATLPGGKANLLKGVAYRVEATFEGNTSTEPNFKIFTIGTDEGNINIQLNPSEMTVSETRDPSKNTIQVSILNAATQQYRVRMISQGEVTKECGTQIPIQNGTCLIPFKLGDEGLTADPGEGRSTYYIQVDNLNNPSFSGSAPFTVIADQSTKDQAGVCTPLPQDIESCEDLKSKGYSVPNETAQVCTPDGQSQNSGFICAKKTDALCKEGSALKCASKTSCEPGELVCPTGFRECSDDSNKCCLRPDSGGGQLKTDKISCDQGATGPVSKSGAVPCDPIRGTPDTGIQTALGCLPTKPNEMVQAFITFATFAGGGIALLIMVIASIGMITSLGNPEKLKNSQEQFAAAVIGLLFIIFSVLLLRVIGVDILGIFPK